MRYGIVLNHEKMQFELWLMGQNAEVQKNYWNLLKTTKWNQNQTDMPKYSLLEVVIAPYPDFDNLDDLTSKIMDNANTLAVEITQYIKNINSKHKKLAGIKTSNSEYLEWKLNFPQTADDCGKLEPKKKWRKSAMNGVSEYKYLTPPSHKVIFDFWKDKYITKTGEMSYKTP